MPCLQLQYSCTRSDIHKNNWVDTRNGNPENFLEKYSTLFLTYGTMDVEKHDETLIYDTGNFFAAVGGNLGLFLGFSCLSIIYTLVDLTVMKFWKQ